MVKGTLIVRPSVRSKRGSAITVADITCELLSYVNIALPDIEPITEERRDSVERAILDAVNDLPRKFSGRIRKVRNPREGLAAVSEYLCGVWESVGAFGGCDQETISGEVAQRKGTTVQGAHAWMVRFIALHPAGGIPTRLVLRSEARNACREQGAAGIDEMARWYQSPVYFEERQLLAREKERCKNG